MTSLSGFLLNKGTEVTPIMEKDKTDISSKKQSVDNQPKDANHSKPKNEEWEADKKAFLASLGERLRIAREAKDLSQHKLGRVINSKSSRISLIENGVQETGIFSVVKLADELGVSMDYLCNRERYLEKGVPEGATMWNVIPPIQALLIVLDQFKPEIVIDANIASPSVTLNFNSKHTYPGRDIYREFFLKYKLIEQIVDLGLDYAEDVDMLAKGYIEKYKDLDRKN